MQIFALFCLFMRKTSPKRTRRTVRERISGNSPHPPGGKVHAKTEKARHGLASKTRDRYVAARFSAWFSIVILMFLFGGPEPAGGKA